MRGSWRSVGPHEVEVDKVVDVERIEHDYNAAEIGPLDLGDGGVVELGACEVFGDQVGVEQGVGHLRRLHEALREHEGLRYVEFYVLEHVVRVEVVREVVDHVCRSSR